MATLVNRNGVRVRVRVCVCVCVRVCVCVCGVCIVYMYGFCMHVSDFLVGTNPKD